MKNCLHYSRALFSLMGIGLLIAGCSGPAEQQGAEQSDTGQSATTLTQPAQVVAATSKSKDAPQGLKTVILSVQGMH